MVTWAPQLSPINPEEETQRFRPISDISADKSRALTIGAVGDTLESGVKVAETLETDYIKDKTRAGVEALRGTTTAAFEDINASMRAGLQPGPQSLATAGFSMKLLENQEQAEDVPEGLQAGIDRVGNVAQARTQGVLRANDTLYTGQMNALVKQLRAEFPGHRDFIDEQIAKISGINPANAYMANLLTDINNAGKNKDTYETKLMGLAFKNYGQPGMPAYINAARANLPGSRENLEKAVYQAESESAKYEGWKRTNDMGKGDSAADADLAKGQSQIRVASIYARHANPILDIPGITSVAMTRKILDDARAGKFDTALSPQQWESLGQNMRRAMDLADDEVKQTLNNEGYSRRLKDPAWEKTMVDNERQVMARMSEAIDGKNAPMLLELQRRSKGFQDQAMHQALSDTKIGPYLLMSGVYKQQLGDQWINRLDSIGLSKGYLGDLQSFYNDSMKRAGVPDDIRKDGTAKSMYSDIAKVREYAKKNIVPGRLYDDLVDNVNLIVHAKETGRLDIAKEVADYTFDPKKNSQIMSLFGRDFVDADGKSHKGYFGVYDTLSKPKIVDGVHAIGDRDVWNKMKDWQEISFKKLFGEEAKNLNAMQQATFTTMAQRAGSSRVDIGTPPSLSDFKVNWDGETGQIFFTGEAVERAAKYRSGAGSAGYPPEVGYVKTMERSKDALNGGLANLRYMYKKEGTDPNAGALNMLLNLGFQPTENLGGSGFTERVIDAIAASKKPVLTPQQKAMEGAK